MKMALLPSPASTATPAASARGEHPSDRSDSACGSDYQELPELAHLAPGRAKCRRLRKLLPKAVPAVLLLTAAAACWITVKVLPAMMQPRIWDPDLRLEFRTEPLAKSVIRKFDGYNMARGGRDDAATFRANVAQYMAPDLLYESVGFGTWTTPAGWSRGEEHNYGMAFPETIFTQMLFFGDQKVATTTTYGSALWGGDLLGMKAPHQWVTLRITDFYGIREEAPGFGRISYNFMMIDWADVFRQVGRRMLPKAPLEEGIVLPPTANDGVPAPLSVVVQAQGRDPRAARAVAEAALQEDWGRAGSPAAPSWHKTLTYFGPGGIGLARGILDYTEHVLGPFQAAFADRKAIVELSACEGNYCGLFGRLHGHGVKEWLGLPVVGRNVSFRYAMHYRVVGDKVQEGWAIFDFPGLFAELGLDFYALAAAGGRF